MTRAPWLLLAVGNPSRGDDALGPALLDRLHALGMDRGGEVELLADFQLQVEHALDLQGRRAVLFVDAARPGVVRAASLTPIEPDDRLSAASHALRPQAVLHVARQLAADVPPAWLLAIEGGSFTLGEGLSAGAERHLALAVDLAWDWLQAQRAGLAVETGHA